MQCPYCNGDSSVSETRVTADGMRRRRTCTVCKRRFTTYEKVGAPSLRVGKRDGSVEPFELDKLVHALRRVCAHRAGVGEADLLRVARDIEATLVDSSRKVIAWSDLASLVHDRLANLDAVAAQRFAADYTDETGLVRFAAAAAGPSAQQLGLPLAEDE